MTTQRRALCALAALGLALTACASPQPEATKDDVVTLVTHDSFHIDPGLLADFEARTGLKVEHVTPGDGGALVNQLILTKDNPLGDVAYGVDSTFASRAVEEGVFAPYTSQEPAAADAAAYALPGDDTLTAIDYSDVCLNVDDTWFAEKGLTPPSTLEDLLDPAYRDLAVVPAATTSSPGLAFLLATVAAFGEGWPEYWQGLLDNGLKVVPGWSDAYYTDFTAGGEGERPVVLSYASSPPYTIPEGEERPATSALLRTCFRQVEYAGVLAGTDDPEGAGKLVDLLLSEEFQAGIPESMYVYPVSSAVELPEDWARWAPLAEEPLSLDPQDVAEHREEWLRQWSQIVTG